MEDLTCYSHFIAFPKSIREKVAAILAARRAALEREMEALRREQKLLNEVLPRAPRQER